MRQEKLQQRFKYEGKRKGEWELIFPSQEESRNEEYDTMIKKANEIWDEFTTGKGTKFAERRNQGSKMVNKPQGPTSVNRQQNQSISNLKGSHMSTPAQNRLERKATNTTRTIESHTNSISNTPKP